MTQKQKKNKQTKWRRLARKFRSAGASESRPWFRFVRFLSLAIGWLRFFFGGGGFHRFRDRFLGRSCRNRSRLQRCRMSADRRLPLVQQQLMKIILEENEIFGQKKKFEKWIFFPTPLQQQLSSVAFRFEGASFFWFVFLFLFVNFPRFFFAYGSREWQWAAKRTQNKTINRTGQPKKKERKKERERERTEMKKT